MLLSALLGIDEEVLKETSPAEQSGFHTTGLLFAAVCITVVAADAWFGYLFHGSWLAVVLAGNFLGYIHFSVYRLAMITLTTRALNQAGDEADTPSDNFFKSWIRMDAAALFRLIFVGLIALAVAFPGASIFFFRQVDSIQESHRLSLLASANTDSLQRLLSDPELRFPFEVFRQLLRYPAYQFLLFLWMLWIFAPMLLLARLRHGKGMEYTRMMALRHRQESERNFFETLLDAQQQLDKKFGKGISLKERIIYEDPPFNTRIRNTGQLQFAGREDFHNYLRTL